MARAVSVQEDLDETRDPDLDQDAMILMIQRYVWEVLCIQAKAEGTTPAIVLDKALKAYLEEHGAEEAVQYIWKVSRESRGI